MIRTDVISLLGLIRHSLWLQGFEQSKLTFIKLQIHRKKNSTETAVCTSMWARFQTAISNSSKQTWNSTHDNSDNTYSATTTVVQSVAFEQAGMHNAH